MLSILFLFLMGREIEMGPEGHDPDDGDDHAVADETPVPAGA